MDSSKVPAPSQQNSYDLFCDICNIDCTSRNFHYDEPHHKNRAKELAYCLFGYIPEKRIICLDDLFSDPKRKGCFIGLHYLKIFPGKGGNLSISCILCDIRCSTMYQHLLSVKHRRKYICKDFYHLFREPSSLNLKSYEKIANIIEEVEGIQKFKIAMKNPVELSAYSERSSRETIDKIVALFKVRGIDFKSLYAKRNIVPCLEPGSNSYGTNEKKAAINLSIPSKASVASKYTSRQVNATIIEKQQIHKDTYQKINALKTGSRNFGTNGKPPTINPSVPSEPSTTTKYTSRQVHDKIIGKERMRQIDFKDICRKENALKTESHVSGQNGKRPSQSTPLAAVKRCKLEQPGQYAGKPIALLSRPAPEPFSFSHTSAGVPVSYQMHEHNSSGSSKLPTTSYIPTLINRTASKPIPSLYGSYQTAWPPVKEHFPSWSPAESISQNAQYGYSSYSNQSLYGFANQSSHGQARSGSHVGQAYGFEGQPWGQKTGEPSTKPLYTMETMGGSVSPSKRHSGQYSTEASLKQDTTSRYGYNSMDSKELSSKCPSPSRIISVFNKEPSLAKSVWDINPPEDVPPTTSTNLSAKSSQSTNSIIPVETASVLSPDTLKILQGRDPTSVKSILKRLSEYCPELQQVNISLLVDVLFESGALQ